MGSNQSTAGSSSPDSGLKRFSRVDLKSVFKAPFNGQHTRENVKEAPTQAAHTDKSTEGEATGGQTTGTETDYKTPIYQTTAQVSCVLCSFVAVSIDNNMPS